MTFKIKSIVSEGILKNKRIAITGGFTGYSREDIAALIEKHAGTWVDSVSGKTSLVIAGEAAGSKLDKAKNLGVTIVSLEEFLKMIGEV